MVLIYGSTKLINLENLIGLSLFNSKLKCIIYKIKKMAKITLKGNPVNTSGNLPSRGAKAPGFRLVKSDLGELTLEELRGKKVILDISPSLDTSVCATAIRKFNELAAGRNDTVVLAITKDPPVRTRAFLFNRRNNQCHNAIRVSATAHSAKTMGLKLLTAVLPDCMHAALLSLTKKALSGTLSWCPRSHRSLIMKVPLLHSDRGFSLYFY